MTESWESIYFIGLNGKTTVVCNIGGSSYGFTLVDPAAWIREALDIFGATGHGVDVIVRFNASTNARSIEHPVSGRVLPFGDVQRPAPDPVDAHSCVDDLAFINRVRARYGQRKLDPVAAGWTDQDISDEACRLRLAGYQ